MTGDRLEKLKMKMYKNALKAALKDGKITEEEQNLLDAILNTKPVKRRRLNN